MFSIVHDRSSIVKRFRKVFTYPLKHVNYSNLWPWRYWMTIGIGVVCTDKSPSDCFILASDKLGSFGDGFSTKRHAKLFVEGKDGLFAVCAGSIETASEFLPKVIEQWKTPGLRSFAFLKAGIQEAFHEYKRYQFVMNVLPKYAISLKEDWREVAKKMGIEDELFGEWNGMDIGFEVIVGTYDWRGVAQLYSVYGNGEVLQLSMPGFGAIGSGAQNAMFWLGFREQSLGMSLLRSAYHVFEAKVMAEQSPHVGKDDIEMLVVTPTTWYLLNDRNKTYENCTISLETLKELQAKFWPSTTESLGGL